MEQMKIFLKQIYQNANHIKISAKAFILQEDTILSSPELSVKTFEGPTEEWAKFVITNRNYNKIENPQEDNNADNRYDIVFGPIANDDLALLEKVGVYYV